MRTRCSHGDGRALVQRGDEEQDLLVHVGQLARRALSLLNRAADVHQHCVAPRALPLSEEKKTKMVKPVKRFAKSRSGGEKKEGVAL